MINKILKTTFLSIISILLILSLAIPVLAAQPLKNTAAGTPGANLKKSAMAQERVNLTGASLTSVSGTTLTITKDGKTITVTTDTKSRFRRKFWGKAALSEMQSGDILNIHGRWTDSTQTKLLGILVRDTSIQKRFGVFVGQVQTVNSSGFVMDTAARGTQTVTLEATAKIINRTGTAITQDRILAGHKVKVRGLWDKTRSTITAVANVKDYSLPVSTKVKPSITVTE